MLNFTEIKSSTSLKDDLKHRLKTLTDRERKYFMMMYPKSGVLYITSKPGIAKSAISKSIAKKMGYRHMDIRLSMVDETDVGLYPSVDTIDGVKCLDFIVPRWAVEANKVPTIIHFEEINRATQNVRNAALQILLERQIGIDFKFNEGVLMMSSGNLGEEDGCDVEEFDSALNNRLIHVDHTLSHKEWINNYAKDNIHSLIVSYIESYPELLYKEAGSNTKAFATPRSWTFFSDYLITNFGRDSTVSDLLPHIVESAFSYVGNSSVRFIKYCNDLINITAKDILDRFDDIESDLDKFNRDKNSELINSLKVYKLKDLKQSQISNLIKFLNRIGDDEKTSYLLYLIDSEHTDPSDPKTKKFFSEFREHMINIRRINSGKN